MAGNVTVQRSGVRTVELFIPYEFQGIKYDAIGIAPCLLDHTQRWRDGLFKDWFALLVELAHDAKTGKPMRADDLRQLRYPDADRVIANFFEVVPAEIRQAAVGESAWPTRDGSVPRQALSDSAPSSVSGEAVGGLLPDEGMNIGDDT